MHQHELEWKLIYSVIVAGKSAAFAAGAMNRLMPGRTKKGFPYSPFTRIRKWIKTGNLSAQLTKARTGNYTKLTQFLIEISTAKLDLRECTPADLEQLHGIGPKTSRFFILWTRPHRNERYAALDVHILRWMSLVGYDAPKQTPQSAARYLKLEQQFIAEADKRGVTPRELDHAIWVESAASFTHERTPRTRQLIQVV